MAEVLRDAGRDVVDHVLNHAEPAAEDCPARVAFGDETYRRRKRTPNTIGTLFGPIELNRCVYECLEAGEACLWPLELRLGIVAGLATPALAERVGRWSADHEQNAVLEWLHVESRRAGIVVGDVGAEGGRSGARRRGRAGPNSSRAMRGRVVD